MLRMVVFANPGFIADRRKRSEVAGNSRQGCLLAGLNVQQRGSSASLAFFQKYSLFTAMWHEGAFNVASRVVYQPTQLATFEFPHANFVVGIRFGQYKNPLAIGEP